MASSVVVFDSYIRVRDGATVWSTDDENEIPRCMIVGMETKACRDGFGYLFQRGYTWYRVGADDVEVIMSK